MREGVLLFTCHGTAGLHSSSSFPRDLLLSPSRTIPTVTVPDRLLLIPVVVSGGSQLAGRVAFYGEQKAMEWNEINKDYIRVSSCNMVNFSSHRIINEKYTERESKKVYRESLLLNTSFVSKCLLKILINFDVKRFYKSDSFSDYIDS